MAAVSQHAMRRHSGGPLDPSTTIGSSFYALGHQQIVRTDKSKKSWSQRLKLSKSEKLLVFNEPLEYTEPSALSRSMKYAEPWLYGTIRGIPAPSPNRPHSLFGQLPEVAVMICSCPEYIQGTKRDPKKATICKKCRGTRLPLATIGGTVRLPSTYSVNHNVQRNGSAATLRLPTITSKQRPSILNPDNDPYDMMRRSRLISPELQTVNNNFKSTVRNRAKSSSPSRGRSRSRKRSPSPGFVPNGLRSRSASRTKGWINEAEAELAAARKSILQCDLNAYELISKTSHNNEFSPMADDDVFHLHSKKYENILNSEDNFCITALAGQRMKISSNKVSSVQEAVENYEEMEVINGNDQIDQSECIKNDNPQIIENESPETSPPKNEYILTTASLSHISTDMASNLQINVIKSILKRPASLSSESDNDHSICGSGTGTRSKAIFISSKSSAVMNDSKNNIAKGKISTILSKGANVTTVETSNGHLTRSGIEKRNSGSHFYLPMPQRKKVQFLVENEIIRDDDNDKIDDASNGIAIQINGNKKKDDDHENDDHRNRIKTTTSFDDQFSSNSDGDFNVTIASSVECAANEITCNGRVQNENCTENVQIDQCYGDRDQSLRRSIGSLEDNDLPFRKTITLRRTLSDSRSNETAFATENVTFMDTTALRNKPNRSDSRYIFPESNQLKNRPKDPPPPPPTVITNQSKTIPIRPPRQLNRKQSTASDMKKDKHTSANLSGVKLIINESGLTDEQVNNTTITTINCDDENNEQRKRIQANIEAFQGSRLFGQLSPSKKTIVKVAPLVINKESPAIHRLEIRNSTDEYGSEGSAKKTSILINGDDCYSTINVNDDTPLYQSSVVVNGTVSRPHTILKNSSNTVSISVTTPPTSKTNVDFDGVNQSISKCRSVIPINNFSTEEICPLDSGRVTPQAKTTIQLDYKESPDIPLESYKEPQSFNGERVDNDQELLVLLRNPVEAVKRNLVPHVCGKTNYDEIPKFTNKLEAIPERPIESNKINEKLLHTDNTSFIKKLLEDPTLGQLAEGLENELIAKLIENSLIRLKESRQNLDMSGTKDDKDMNKLIDTSLQKVKEERIKLESVKSEQEKLDDDHEKHSMSSGNSYSSANYEPYDFDNNDLSDCYQSCSSELTVDDDGNVTRSKFYQMLVDATLSEIEISTNVEDDHHYESIRMNGDPIYEEINDVPPPLPLCPPPMETEVEKKNSKSMFEGASKYDILSYLVDAKERGIVPEDSYTYNFSNTADIIVEEEAHKVNERINNRQNSDISSRMSQLSNVSDTSDESSLKLCSPQWKGSAEIERNDSGVGSETSKTSRSKYQSLPGGGSLLTKNSPIHLCEDCDGPVETQITDSGVMFAPLVCRKCSKKRAERKEIVTEFIETEEKYSRDLQIILEEFYQPMLVAGLLTQEQLSAIFLNSEELLENSQALADKMRDAFDIAVEQGDDDLLTVNIGKLMLDAAPMLHAFESYCIRQAAASLLLANLEKEKELLRIFLRVSQMENAVLRRMNLNSFLMVPVQRVTKYPLLLARLFKVTPTHVEGRDLLKQAQEKIELHLNHMNREAKDVPTKLWRRISSSSPGRRSSCEIDMINIKLRKMAIDLLEWHHDEVRFTIEGKLLFTQPTDNNWRKGRTIKLTPINAMLVTNGKPTSTYKIDKVIVEQQLNFPRHTGIREAALLMVREKSGRYTLLREPLYLDRCIVCTESDWEDYFEVQEISSKDTFIFKAEDGTRTKLWYTQLQYHAQGMGAWRKRRNALANIMINGMMMRT